MGAEPTGFKVCYQVLAALLFFWDVVNVEYPKGFVCSGTIDLYVDLATLSLSSTWLILWERKVICRSNYCRLVWLIEENCSNLCRLAFF
jgi:hypothetical protein